MLRKNPYFVCKIPLICLFIFLFLVSGSAAVAQPSQLLTVRADPSLTLALPAIARNFTRRQSVAVDISFSPPSKELALIESGAPVDVYISPMAASISRLRNLTMIDSFTQVAIAKNRLALAGPVSSPLVVDFENLNPSLQLQEGDRNLLIASPLQNSATSHGFIEQAMDNLSIGADFRPYMFWMESMDLLEKTLNKPGSHALLYESDVNKFPKLKILGLMPETSHAPIVYHAVAIEGPHVANARAFLQYLQTEEAQQTLKEYGFTPLAVP